MITYLIALSLEIEIVVLEKSLEKVLNFGTTSLYEPCLLSERSLVSSKGTDPTLPSTLKKKVSCK